MYNFKNYFFIENLFIFYKITYKFCKFNIFIKKKINFNSFNRKFIKNLIYNFFTFRNFYYGFDIIVIFKNIFNKNFYFNFKYIKKKLLLKLIFIFNKIKFYL